ncbi:uncharacterized protein M6B38_205150 [Iris pallida]|uniref:Uncharacterized protein n=1 Tax=Iris pallida TaxID=29817 RepID=A0AAX6E7Z2_IRIPA|nr:uncharacterized protein M6B38_205150 [Iris pallida]
MAALATVQSLPTLGRLLTSRILSKHHRVSSCRSRHCVTMIKCKSETSSDADDSNSTGTTTVGLAAAIGGLVSNPVIGWSLYTLKTTGCGLPPGPGGSIGALEGVSYLVVAGIVAWSIYTKAKTGRGLPSGPYGILGAVEGLSYLTLLAILVVFGLQFFDRGYIPGPLPADQCFG